MLYFIFLIACSNDTVIEKQSNRNPTITITSHTDGSTVQEGMAVTFRAQVTDDDNELEELTVAWFIGEQLTCDWTVPDSAGTSYCELALQANENRIVAEVRDPDGAGGMDEVNLNINATDAPVVSILSPVNANTYYADQLIQFSAVIYDTEDVPEDLTVVWSSNIDGDLNLSVTPDTNGAIENYTLLSQGQHAIDIRVEDTSGKVSSKSVVIDVGGVNSIPSCALTEPLDGAEFGVGDAVILRGTATDPDIPNETLLIEWSSDRDGVLGTPIPDSSGEVTLVTDTLSPNLHTIRFSVTDDVGATCSDTILLSISGMPTFTDAAAISPSAAYVESTLTCTASATDEQDGTLLPTFVWSVNGNVVETGSVYVVQQGDVNVGDTLVCTASVSDSDGNTQTSVDAVSILNSSPSAPSISITPGNPEVQVDDLTCAITGPATDLDNHAITYQFSWEKDGVSFPASAGTANDSTIYATETTLGEVWTCFVFANDGYVDGPTTSTSVTIGNGISEQYDFTTCGASGPNGPDSSACSAEYAGTSLDGAVAVSSGVQSWTVPYTGTYLITANGAQGGDKSHMSAYGGDGSEVSGEFSLTAGEVLYIIVGQAGTDATSGNSNIEGGGGGGGSFVLDSSNGILLIAGGGGGASYQGNSGTGGSNGSSSTGSGYGTNNSGSGGFSDNGGGGGCGCGGGGYNSAGTSNTWCGGGGAMGGVGGSSQYAKYGGFGGGGGAFHGGGGGGGYSGAGGGTYTIGGGGGGSYNNGSNQINTSSANSGHGWITIETM